MSGHHPPLRAPQTPEVLRYTRQRHFIERSWLCDIFANPVNQCPRAEQSTDEDACFHFVNFHWHVGMHQVSVTAICHNVMGDADCCTFPASERHTFIPRLGVHRLPILDLHTTYMTQFIVLTQVCLFPFDNKETVPTCPSYSHSHTRRHGITQATQIHTTRDIQQFSTTTKPV